MFLFRKKPAASAPPAQGDARMTDKPIKVFALSTCSHCKNARKLLDTFNVPYEVVEVDLCTGAEREQAINDVKKVNPQCSFPTLIIGDKVIVGYKEDEIKEALGL